MRPPARPASSNSLRSPISPRSLSSASPTQTTLPTAPPSVRLSTFCIVLNRLDRTVHTGRWKYWSWCLVVPRLWRAWCTEPLLPRELLMLTTAPQRLLCCSDKLIFGFSSIIGTVCLVLFVTESCVESKGSPCVTFLCRFRSTSRVRSYSYIRAALYNDRRELFKK